MTRARTLMVVGGLLLAVAVAAAGGVLLASGEDVKPVKPRGTVTRAGLEGGNLKEFSQVNKLAGTLRPATHEGRRGAEARYTGSAENGYARGIFNVRWAIGNEVSYGGAFFIPSATLEAMQGQVALMRWDDFPEHPEDANQGGLVIFGRDRRMHLIRAELSPTGERQTILTDAIDVPVDRWFTAEVRQRLGPKDARNEVYIDGRVVAESPQPNIRRGRAVSRVRYGIVSTAGVAQQRPLQLWIDDLSAQPGAVAGG